MKTVKKFYLAYNFTFWKYSTGLWETAKEALESMWEPYSSCDITIECYEWDIEEVRIQDWWHYIYRWQEWWYPLDPVESDYIAYDFSCSSRFHDIDDEDDERANILCHY
jgi:hypothetical protein